MRACVYVEGSSTSRAIGVCKHRTHLERGRPIHVHSQQFSPGGTLLLSRSGALAAGPPSCRPASLGGEWPWPMGFRDLPARAALRDRVTAPLHSQFNIQILPRLPLHHARHAQLDNVRKKDKINPRTSFHVHHFCTRQRRLSQNAGNGGGSGAGC